MKHTAIAVRVAAARQWRRDNKPYFEAIYGPNPFAARPIDHATEPRAWRVANKAAFDALYGVG